MATVEEVKKLASLARISVDDTELEKFTKEFDAILAYVSQLEKLEVAVDEHGVPPLHNVMREDGEPHEGGRYTQALAAQFPVREGDALSVKQVITHE